MRVTRRSKAALMGIVFTLVTGWSSDIACGQQATDRSHVFSGAGSTVSVATLRVPEKAWRHFAKAQAAAAHNNLAECERETLKAITIAPDFAAAYLLRADTFVHQHAFKVAIDNVREARRVEPGMMWAGVVLAGAYNGLHQYEETQAVLRGIQGVEAQSWQAAYESARAAIGMNDVASALRWSAVALDSAPKNFIDAHLVRTNAFLLAHRWSEAQAQMESYLQSKGPQEHRAEVLMALQNAKLHAREDELRTVASR